MNLVQKGKQISYLLRHNPDGLDMDKNGWVLVDDLLKKVNITKEQLDEIVETNNKKRYKYSDDGLKIRASQGHSINIDLELKPIKPPTILYHGTAKSNEELIRKEGLKPMTRKHIHLSIDKETAIQVGKRHSKDIVILEITAGLAHFDGVKFYKSDNDVYLADVIESKYIK